jgi:antirestriction protein ArdC
MDQKSIHREVTDTILASLEKGTLPWRKTWTTQGGATSYIPANGFTGRPHKGINRLILWASGMAKGYPSRLGHVPTDEPSRGTRERGSEAPTTLTASR